MKSKSADKIKMPSIDELLGVSGEESATDIEISRIHSFANHPFKVLDDDSLASSFLSRICSFLGRTSMRPSDSMASSSSMR